MNRAKFFQVTIKHFKAKGGTRIIEIGSIRNMHGKEGDGHSTKAWVAHAKEVYSVDTDPQATVLTRHLCGRRNLSAVTMDGIAFLKHYQQPIDLLYLDGWDVGTPEFQERHLDAYLAARPNLTGLILIDDTHPDGKGKLVIPKATADGWRVVFQDYMTLLERP